MTKILFTASRQSHFNQFHLPYLEYYSKKGFKVFTAAQGEASYSFDAKHYNIEFYKGKPWKNLKTVFAVKKIIRTEKIDVVISNATLAGIITRLAVLFCARKPVVIHSCHGYLFSKNMPKLKKAIMLFIEKFFAPITKLCITMNYEDFEAAEKHRLGKIVRNIPGIGIKPYSEKNYTAEEIIKAKKAILGNFYRDSDVLYFVYAAEFSKRKNQQQLFEYFLPLLRQNPDWVLILAGTGSEWQNIQNQVLQENMQNQVILPGFVKKIDELLTFCNFVVSFSKSEGLPFNLMEAMQHKKPVIASRVKGHSDLIEDGENGFLFNLDNFDEFKEKIEKIARNTSLQKDFAEKSSQKVAFFELNNVFDQIIKTYTLADGRLE